MTLLFYSELCEAFHEQCDVFAWFGICLLMCSSLRSLQRAWVLWARKPLSFLIQWLKRLMHSEMKRLRRGSKLKSACTVAALSPVPLPLATVSACLGCSTTGWMACKWQKLIFQFWELESPKPSCPHGCLLVKFSPWLIDYLLALFSHRRGG